MPLYEYVCEDGHRTERLEKHPTGTTRCEHAAEGRSGPCGKDALRTVSAASIPQDGRYSYKDG